MITNISIQILPYLIRNIQVLPQSEQFLNNKNNNSEQNKTKQHTHTKHVTYCMNRTHINALFVEDTSTPSCIAH